MNPIFDHVKFGRYSEVHKYILAGNNVNATNGHRSLLTYAIHRNHYNIAKLLIDHGAKLIDDNISNSPVHIAAKCGRKKIFRYICSLNLFDVNLLRYKHESILLNIVRRGKLHMYKTLMSTGAVNDEILILYHMLHRHDIFGKFINKHIDINKVDPDGNNILHYLVQDSRWDPKCYNKNIIEIAISLGADIKHKNENGLYPISKARSIGNARGTCNLIFDTESISNVHLQTDLLDDAIRTNNIEKCKLIMSVYNDINSERILWSLIYESTQEMWELLLPRCNKESLFYLVTIGHHYKNWDTYRKIKSLQRRYPEFLSEKNDYLDELLVKEYIYKYIDKLNLYPLKINQRLLHYNNAWNSEYNKLIILLSEYRTRYLQNSIGGYFKCLSRDIIRYTLVPCFNM